MAPDADAGKASQHRADPFAPLTSEQIAVGDGHDIHVESVGRQDGIAAVYLHGGPGSGCQPDHRRLFDPERFHAVLFDQRGAGRSRPKGGREHNTLPHLIADMEMIREKFGFERWMVVGGSWGATLALAYAQAHPHRVTGIALRATFAYLFIGAIDFFYQRYTNEKSMRMKKEEVKEEGKGQDLPAEVKSAIRRRQREGAGADGSHAPRGEGLGPREPQQERRAVFADDHSGAAAGRP